MGEPVTRPLRSWPDWALDVAERFTLLRHMWGDVWIERHERAREATDAAARDVTNDETRPWMVRLPPGMH